ncbi:hypothetical protein [Methylorubrum salsuginis]|uniref:Uncharacterized protein n=1 Tax=Methylorubrum salsuginis TaxID=414703 RepID=A0A1I4D0N6_9HYPH|nr:hypothetical protein [Methylorubrum salsuginis]SFK86269.1 hypothetical protein SAMN04488125_10587 [Methylorubrum salsuginis]
MHAISGRRTMLRDDLTTGQDARRAEAEALAQAYRTAHRGDDQAALVAAISDALADLDATEERAAATRRAVSHGFVRGRIGAP